MTTHPDLFPLECSIVVLAFVLIYLAFDGYFTANMNARRLGSATFQDLGWRLA